MRSKEDKDKKVKIIFSAVIAFVFLSSIIGFATTFNYNAGGQDGTISYNGMEFLQNSNGLATVFDNQVLTFGNYPENVQDLETHEIVQKISNSRMVYTTSHPNDSLASLISGTEFDMARVLKANYNSHVEVAFTKENSFNKAIITCNDASEFVPVIFFNFTNTSTSLENKDNCIIINIDSEYSMGRIHDKLIYDLLGVNP